MQLICSDYAQFRIPKFPPELMADDGDLDRPLGHAGILYGMDDARRSHEEDQHNEHGNYCPGDLDLVAAVNLRRLRAIVGTPAELYDGIRDQTENNYKNEARDGQNQH